MAPHHFLGESELEAELADFVFEEVAQWFDQLEAEFGGQAADVVMRFDRGRGTVEVPAALNDIGVESTLGEKAGVSNVAGFVAEDVNEEMANPPPLFLRIGNAILGAEKAVPGIDDMEVGEEMIAKRMADAFGFAGAEQPIIDKDASNLRPDGADEQRRGH
jgi:hypothetical protein